MVFPFDPVSKSIVYGCFGEPDWQVEKKDLFIGLSSEESGKFIKETKLGAEID